MEYHSAVKKKKKNETLPFATMWMDLASIMLSEKCHTGKRNSKLSFICGMHKIKQANIHNRRETHRYKEQIVITMGKGGGGR